MKNLEISKVLEILKANQDAQIDIVVNTSSLGFASTNIYFDEDIIKMSNESVQKELCNRLGMPYSYYSILRDNEEHGKEFNRSVIYWMEFSDKFVLIRCYLSDQQQKGFSKTLDCRAVMSKKYLIINHYDAFSELINQLYRNVSENVTVVRFYPEQENSPMIIELDIPGISANISEITGQEDSAIMGVLLTNSELGRGIFSLQPYIRFSNGAVFMLEYKLNRVHLGKDIEPGVYDGGIDSVDFTLSTISELTAELVTVLNTGTIINTVSEIYTSLKTIIPKSSINSIENYIKGVGLNTDESMTVLNQYLKGDDKSAYAAYMFTVCSIQDNNTEVNYYDRLDKARILAFTFGEKNKRNF